KLFYASVGVLPAPFIFIFTRIRQIVTTLLLRSARYIFRWMPKHMQFESLETRRIRVIVHLVGIRSKRPFHPFLKKRFLFELAYSPWRNPICSRGGRVFLGASRTWVGLPSHNPCICAIRI